MHSKLFQKNYLWYSYLSSPSSKVRSKIMPPEVHWNFMYMLYFTDLQHLGHFWTKNFMRSSKLVSLLSNFEQIMMKKMRFKVMEGEIRSTTLYITMSVLSLTTVVFFLEHWSRWWLQLSALHRIVKSIELDIKCSFQLQLWDWLSIVNYL